MKALLLRAALGFMPGGWLVNAALTALKAVWTFLCWLGADIADAFKEPWRFCVRTICGVAILLLGVYLGMGYMREQRDVWRDAHRLIERKMEAADAANKKELSAALKTKADADAKLKANTLTVKTAPVGPAAGAKRVRDAGPAPKGARKDG